MAQNVRIGFVGTGGIARHHLNQLRSIPEAEVVALTDRVEERAVATAEEFGGTVYPDHQALLGEAELDALYVCVPPFAHTDAEILAAKRGVHLFVEKPVALTLEKAQEIAVAIREAGVMSSAGYVLRYFKGTTQARRLLEGREIAMVASNRWGGIPGAPWWREMDKSGGQLVEMTTHQVDLMRVLAGEIVEVSARSDFRLLRDLPDFTIPDAQVLLLQFQSGTIGYLSTTCALTQGGGRGDLELVTRDAVVRWEGETASVSPESALEMPEVTEPHPSIDEAFVRAVATGDRTLILCDYEEGLRTLDVTLCANRSAEEGGRPVRTLAAG
ncbi:MAG: Gfo/Idh/MocA family oxidoreductase [Armatimonadetes bacterium]|nr:Gfo/Idh/MocA family oxidoreductase [Armatimonadota bacterium]